MGRPSKQPFAIPPELRLPNEGSKCQTPASLKVDLWYAHLNVWQRWTWERFQRLALFLKLTPAELASIACIPHRSLPSFEERNHLYNGQAMDRAAALVLTLLEAHVLREYSRDVIANPFPNLNDLEPEHSDSHQEKP